MSTPSLKVVVAITSPIAFHELKNQSILQTCCDTAGTFVARYGLGARLAIAGSKDSLAQVSEFDCEKIECNPNNAQEFAQSLRNATAADLVMIHDSQRALTTAAQFDRVVQALTPGIDAVRPVSAFTETLKSIGTDQPPLLRHKLIVNIIGGASGANTEEVDRLKELTTWLGIDDVVRFAPPVPRGDLAQWYRAADLVVVPSYSESFGLVALEAQACGTPVVATAVGGLRTAVADGISGVLVDGHDPKAWSSVIARLLQEPQRRVLLSMGAIEHASHFGWDATARGTLDIYDQVITQTRKSLEA